MTIDRNKEIQIDRIELSKRLKCVNPLIINSNNASNINMEQPYYGKSGIYSNCNIPQTNAQNNQSVVYVQDGVQHVNSHEQIYHKERGLLGKQHSSNAQYKSTQGQAMMQNNSDNSQVKKVGGNSPHFGSRVVSKDLSLTNKGEKFGEGKRQLSIIDKYKQEQQLIDVVLEDTFQPRHQESYMKYSQNPLDFGGSRQVRSYDYNPIQPRGLKDRTANGGQDRSIQDSEKDIKQNIQEIDDFLLSPKNIQIALKINQQPSNVKSQHQTEKDFMSVNMIEGIVNQIKKNEKEMVIQKQNQQDQDHNS
eukprot:403362609